MDKNIELGKPSLSVMDVVDLSIYIDTMLRISGIVTHEKIQGKVQFASRQYVKDIVLPNVHWSSVTDQCGYNKEKFLLAIRDTCDLCKKTHPEWFADYYLADSE